MEVLIVWGIVIIIGIIIMLYHAYVIMKLFDFETDRKSPITICETLKKIEIPSIIFQVLITFLTCLLLPISFPLVIVNFGVLIYFVFLKQTKKRFFDPLTIMRDLSAIRFRHSCLFAIGIFNILYSLFTFIYIGVKKNK